MKSTIEECLQRCETKDFDETMISVCELRRAVECLKKLETTKKKIIEIMEDLENTTKGRHMNDLEYGRYSAMSDVLDLID